MNLERSPPKFFLGLEKHNGAKKHIKRLIDHNGFEMTEHEQILAEEKWFYKELYRTRIENDYENIGGTRSIFMNNGEKLNHAQQSMLCMDISEKEISDIIKNSKPSKSP